MAPIEEKTGKEIPNNLNIFIQEFESLIYRGEHNQAKSLIGEIEKKEDIFLEEYDNRKKHGVYYTDPKLARFIAQKTVFTLLNEKIGLDLNSIENIRDLTRKTSQKIVRLLLNTSICDPTCGSGNFLVNAGEVLLDIITNLKPDKAFKDIKTQIIKNLYGFDINLVVVTLSKLKLIKWLFKGKDPNISKYNEVKSILNENIQEKNSLFKLENNKFDLIVGNPPYGNILSEDEKERLRKQKIYNKDAYCAFLLKSMKWCKEYVGFLIPKSFLLRQSYLDFRNSFLSKSNVLEIYNIGSNEFKRATNEVQVIIYGKKKESEKDLKVYDFPDREIIHYQNQEFDSLRACVNSECDDISLMKRFFVYTREEECPTCSCPTTPLNRIRIKCNERIFKLFNQIEQQGDLNYLNINDFPKLIRGEEAKGLRRVKEVLQKENGGDCYYIDAKYDFQYYYFQKNKPFELKSISSDLLKGDSKEYYTSPKLLIKHNSIYPEALFTEDNTCFTSSIYSLLHEENRELKYLCALLNSALIHFYCIYAINNQNDTTINLNQYMIRHLPIADIRESKKVEIAEIVDNISQELDQTKGNLKESIKEKIITLNTTIFKIYNIEKNQQRFIIEKVKRYNPYFKSVY